MKRLVIVLLLLQTSMVFCQYRQSVLSITSEGTSTLVLDVGSYYPLKDTIDYLNHEYGWLISYEDPLYLESQLTDIAVPSWKKNHPGERGFYVPPWTEWRVRIARPSGRVGERSIILNDLVAQYNRLDREDKYFIVDVSNTRSTVVGQVRGMEVLASASIPTQPKERNGSEEMHLLTEQCSTRMPLQLTVGTVPLNGLAHTTIPARKTAVSCRSALETLVERCGDNLVYQVMEGITDQMFVVSIVPNRVVVSPTR